MVVLGILGILAVLATCFTTLAQLERRASGRRVNASRSLLLARSGLEDVLARIDAGQDPEDAASAYGAEDRVRPLSAALRPSFPCGTVQVDGRLRGFSGRLGTRLDYALKVERPGGFFVNGGDPAQPASEGYNAVLRRMLGILAEAVDRETDPRAGILTETDGLALIDARPSQGWSGFDEIRDLALGGDGQKMALLRPYLCLESWVDFKVIRPNAAAAMAGTGYDSSAALKQARGGPPGFESVGVRPVGRAPVSLPWARRHRPALIALLGGLKGLWLDESTAEVAEYGGGRWGHGKDILGTLAPVELVLDWSLPGDDCRDVADQILASDRPLETWGEWEAFCNVLRFPSQEAPVIMRRDAAQASIAALEAEAAARLAARDAAQALYESDPTPENEDLYWTADWDAYVAQSNVDAARGEVAAQQALLDRMRGSPDWPVQKSLLKANFNPNSDLNKFNPDPSLRRLVDKSDLLVYSTEFELLDRRAARIEILGRVLDDAGRLEAQRSLAVDRAEDRRLTLTTQREFMASSLGSLDHPGDEGDPRVYGSAVFVSPNRGIGMSFGHALWGGTGVSLQTGPEPHTVARPSDIDGQVRLATLETVAGEFVPASALTFLARFDDGPDADLGLDRTARLDPGHPPADRAVWDPAAGGAQRPDGIYLEKGRQPGYSAVGHFPPRHGVISFWIKPDYDVGQYPRSDMERRRNLLNHSLTGPGDTSAVFLLNTVYGRGWGSMDGAPPWGFTLFWENQLSGTESHHEQFRQIYHIAQPGRWRLLTVFWDMAQSDGIQGTLLWLDSGTEEAERNTARVYDWNNGLQIDPPSADFGTGLFWLGSNGPGTFLHVDLKDYAAPDATLDEFALYDLGSSAAGAQALAAARFRAGRFYRESDFAALGDPANRAAEYWSAPLNLGDVRLRELAWTQVVPRGLQASPPGPPPRPGEGDPGPEGEILLSLSDLSGASPAPDRAGRPLAAGCADGRGQAIGRVPSGPFRIHAAFRPNLELADTPLLEPLALDDVTLVYTPASGPALLRWTEPR